MVRIEIPKSFRNLDPAFFDSQVYLLGRGSCGHHIVLGRSSTLIAPESVPRSFLLDVPREQLNDYGYQVMSAETSIIFYHHIDFVPSTPSIKLLSLGAQHERGIGKRSFSYEITVPNTTNDEDLTLYYSFKELLGHGYRTYRYTTTAVQTGRRYLFRRVDFTNQVSLLPEALFARHQTPHVGFSPDKKAIVVKFTFDPSSALQSVNDDDIKHHNLIKDENCAICYEKLNPADDNVVRLPKCKHTGHHNCIHRSLMGDDRCPICREEQGYKRTQQQS